MIVSKAENVASSEPAGISKRRVGVGAPLVWVWAVDAGSGDCASVTLVAPKAVYATSVPMATNRYVTGHFEIFDPFLICVR